jgi:hypothetical protein
VLTSLDGITFYGVEDARLFKGNTDRNTKVTHKFKEPVLASVVRLRPISFYGHTSLRFEVYAKPN